MNDRFGGAEANQVEEQSELIRLLQAQYYKVSIYMLEFSNIII